MKTKQRQKTQPKTIQSVPLDFRAEVSSIDEENRTVDLIFSTGADVERMNWWTGERYIERLAVKPENVRLDRLNSGASLLDSHSSYGLSSVLGVVVDGTASMSGGKGTAKVRFAKDDPAADAAWNKVSQKIVRHVSVGYRTHAVEEILPKKKGDMTVRVATDWEPYEISLVPIPADAGAKLRDSKSFDTNSCVIETRALEATMESEETRTEEQEKVEKPDPTEGDLARKAESKRCLGIYQAARAANLSSRYADDLIASGCTLEDARGKCLEEIEKRGGGNAGPRPGPSGVVEVGEDEFDKTRSGITNALLHRVNSEHFKLDDGARHYRAMTLMELGRYILERRGVKVRQLADKSELAGAALGLQIRAGFHTTSDFANILADVFNKSLRMEYQEAPATYRAITRMTTAPDFKNINRVQLGDAPALLEVNEHGEFTRGTISDGKEVYALKTFGRVFAITRKALINDDTSAFSRMAANFGRSARALESDLVWEQITSNPTMGDGNNLFSAAHGNIDSAGVGISVTSLSAARAAMRKQTGLDGQKINIVPAFLITPTALETEAEQIVMPITPNSTTQVNPFSGKLTTLAEPRLDDDSQSAWYVAASPSQVDIVELCMLEGQSGPRLESRIGFDVDGVETKCAHDVAAKVIDWRGLYKNVGDT